MSVLTNHSISNPLTQQSLIRDAGKVRPRKDPKKAEDADELEGGLAAENIVGMLSPAAGAILGAIEALEIMKEEGGSGLQMSSLDPAGSQDPRLAHKAPGTINRNKQKRPF